MKKATLFASILAIFFIGMLNLTAQDLVSTDPQPRNVVLEEFTGIYCGYCPDGHARANKLMQDFPGRVIAINLHSSDQYSKPQIPSHPDFRTQWGPAIAQMSGLTGYPAGQVNRELFPNFGQMTPGKPALNRGGWAAAADQVMKSGNSAVNIGAATSWNSSTRILTIDVELYYTEDAGTNNLVNVAVLENGVIGWQSGGSATYTHNHILRDLLTGQWGEEVKDTDEGDLVKLQYQYNVNEDWDIDNMDVVVFVTKADRTYIYTGIELPAITPLMNVSVSGDRYQVTAEDEKFEKAVIIKNTSASNLNLTYELVKTERTPSDWKAELITKPASIAAGQQAEAMISLTPGATKGVGDATLTILAKSPDGEYSQTIQITAVTPGIDKIEIITTDLQEESIISVIKAATYDGFVSLNVSEYAKFADDLGEYPEILVLNSGKRGQVAVGLASLVNNMMLTGTKVLFTGSIPLPSIFGGNSNHPILKSLGATYQSGNDIQKEYIDLLGVKDDPISDGMTFNQVHALADTRYYMQEIVITNPEVATPIFKVKFTGEVVGFRSTLEFSKAVYVGFDVMVLPNPADRAAVIKKSIDWLMAGEAPSAMIEVDMEDIDFGTLEVGATETVTISNTGDADLEITSIEIDGDSEFELFADSEVTIAPGEDYEFEVVYTPVETMVNNATITITSNAKNMPELTIDVTANSIVSVPAGSAGGEGVFTMTVGPNPVANMGNISYTVNSNSAVNVNIYLVDALGNKVTDLVNDVRSAGTYNATMTTANLSSGVYYLISNANGVNAKLPVVITK